MTTEPPSNMEFDTSGDVEEGLDPMERQRFLILERERKQREANEETTKSEDLANLRQQLQQMRLQQQQQQHQQLQMQQQDISVGGKFYVAQAIGTSEMGRDGDGMMRTISGAGGTLEQMQQPAGDTPYYPDMHIEPPDGGWGWFVVLGSFLYMCLVDGVCFSYGLLISELTSYYMLDPSSCIAMLPGSFITGMYILTGPLANLIANNFDYRRVALLGSICSTVAFAMSFFVQNFFYFLVTFGIFGGIGFGLIYLPAIAIVGSWFNQRRPMAVGLALCGSGTGTLIFGQTTPLALFQMSFSELLITWASISAQCLLFVVLFRPLDIHQRILINNHARKRAAEEKRQRQLKARQEEEQRRLAKAEQIRRRRKPDTVHRGSIMQRIIEEKRRQRTTSVGSLDGMVITKDNELIEALPGQYLNPIMSSNTLNRIAETILKRRRASFIRKERQMDASRDNVSMNRENMTQLVHGYVSQLSLQQGVTAGSRQITANNSQIALSAMSPDNDLNNRKKISVVSAYVAHGQMEIDSIPPPLSEHNSPVGSQTSLTSSQPPKPPMEELTENLKAEIQTELIKELNRPQFRKDAFFTGSVTQLAQGGDLGMAHRSQMSLQQTGGSAGGPVLTTQNSLQHGASGQGGPAAADKEGPGLLRDFVREMFDAKLLNSPTFLLLVSACICSMLGFFVPFHYFPLFMESSKLREAGHIISFMGCANILGRLLATFYTEKNLSARWSCMDCLWIHNGALLIACSSIFIVTLCRQTVVACIVMASIYSLSMAAFISLKSILVVELFGIDRLTNAFSWLLLFQGVSVILSTPLALLLKEVTNDPNTPFYFCAGCILLSALCHMPLRFVADWERHRLEKRFNYMSGDDMEYEMGSPASQYASESNALPAGAIPGMLAAAPAPSTNESNQWRISGAGGTSYHVTNVINRQNTPPTISEETPSNPRDTSSGYGQLISALDGGYRSPEVIEEEREDELHGSSTNVLA